MKGHYYRSLEDWLNKMSSPSFYFDSKWILNAWLVHTSNREGSNLCGSLKNSGLWWMLLNKGITFQPLGIRNPVTIPITHFETTVMKFTPTSPVMYFFINTTSLPLYSTSATASLNVKDMILAILRLSKMTWNQSPLKSLSYAKNHIYLKTKQQKIVGEGGLCSLYIPFE